MSDHVKEEWGTRIGVILAVAGSAVGLGNFLRFPGQAVQNGGGAFMIPYFCALLFLGIPIGWAEWTMGRYGGRKGFNSCPAIMGVFGKGPLFRYLGVIGVLIPLAVSFYYMFIESWCLGYCWKFLTGGIGIDPAGSFDVQTGASREFYNEFIGSKADGSLFSSGIHPVVWFYLLTLAANVYLVFRGLSKGIEKFCNWAMPSMAVCAIIVLIRVLTLSPDPSHPEQTVNAGLGFMWNPDYSALGRAQTWIAAAGQIFFSLSVGFGVIINYASYLKRKDDVVLSGLTASATNELFEVGFGGMITIPAALVFLGATQAMAGAQAGTFSLGFATLPVVFAHMPLGNVIGAIWFFMLFLAAITSSLSMLQPTVAFIVEALGISRKAATAFVALASAAGSFFVLWFSSDSTALTTIDDWIGTFLIVVLAAAQVIAFSWIFGIRRGMDEAHSGARMRIPAFFQFVLMYVAPLYLLFTIGWFCWKDLPKWIEAAGKSPNAIKALWVVLATLVALVVITAVGARRWRSTGMDLDGAHPPEDAKVVTGSVRR